MLGNDKIQQHIVDGGTGWTDYRERIFLMFVCEASHLIFIQIDQIKVEIEFQVNQFSTSEQAYLESVDERKC